MKKKENQRIALTKRLLKESLLQLMSEKSMQNITVSELCDAAGINRSTFYNHYGCPGDILTEIENGVISDLGQYGKEADRQNWPLNRRIEVLCTYLQEHRDVAKLLFRDSDTNSEFPALLLSAAHVQELYEKTLSYAKSQDNKRLVTTFLTTGAYHMIRQWLLEDIPKTPKEMGDLANLVATQGWIRSSNEIPAKAKQ
ncbi:MAG: TetR/AcrR family transcriptional regulator [Candidatus Onthomonas sp.]